MSDPVLHLLAGPNGAGKTSLYDLVVAPTTHLRFVNADRIAEVRWSFVTETVFSHPSKVELVEKAKRAGYLVTLHVVIIREDLAVARVAERVNHGGHSVPEEKIRSRFGRLWAVIGQAVPLADEVLVYDNSRAATPFRLVATRRHGSVVGAQWPPWAAPDLVAAMR